MFRKICSLRGKLIKCPRKLGDFVKIWQSEDQRDFQNPPKYFCPSSFYSCVNLWTFGSRTHYSFRDAATDLWKGLHRAGKWKWSSVSITDLCITELQEDPRKNPIIMESVKGLSVHISDHWSMLLSRIINNHISYNLWNGPFHGKVWC